MRPCVKVESQKPRTIMYLDMGQDLNPTVDFRAEIKKQLLAAVYNHLLDQDQPVVDFFDKWATLQAREHAKVLAKLHRPFEFTWTPASVSMADMAAINIGT